MRKLATTIICGTVLIGTIHGQDKKQQPDQSLAEIALSIRPQTQEVTKFQVKFVAQDTVYLSGGRALGLKEGMKLTVKHLDDHQSSANTGVVAELEVVSVADNSAVCNVISASSDLQKGDTAYLSQADTEAIVQKRSLSGTRSYPQVVTFTEGDPLEEEIRDAVPRPQLPEVNRVQGRIGMDYSTIASHGSASATNSQVGVVFRANISRVLGTYWNLSGYWRGRLSQTAPDGQQSIQDLINRTYHLSMTYDNPNSRMVAGIGRLFLPWANSLDTLDGGYFGIRLSKTATTGVFAGSTPDPTSWSYNPDRRIAGAFVNFTGGKYDAVHYSSTSGFALNSLQWKLDRPFVFFENSVSYQQYLSVYSALQADDPRAANGTGRLGPGLSRSFVTIRISPWQRVSFDINHNYFRDVPTFDPRLIETGLLDKYLFQGLSAGVRVQTWRHLTFYTTLGRSKSNSDMKPSWNQMYGVSSGPIWRTGFRADLRYSKYDSSFGSGNYRSLMLSRNLGDKMHFEAQIGQQYLVSNFTSQNRSRFVNVQFDTNLGTRFFLQGGFTTERGGPMDYDQWTTTIGYRFDNRGVGGH